MMTRTWIYGGTKTETMSPAWFMLSLWGAVSDAVAVLGVHVTGAKARIWVAVVWGMASSAYGCVVCAATSALVAHAPRARRRPAKEEPLTPDEIAAIREFIGIPPRGAAALHL
jgi:hypothetical protein